MKKIKKIKKIISFVLAMFILLTYCPSFLSLAGENIDNNKIEIGENKAEIEDNEVRHDDNKKEIGSAL